MFQGKELGFEGYSAKHGNAQAFGQPDRPRQAAEPTYYFLGPHMNTRKIILLVVSHIAVAAAGFAGGIYALPILIAPAPPTAEDIKAAASQAKFTAQFKRDLKDSDSLHWGEGVVSIAPNAISFIGRLAPGPDYKLYLSPEFVETEADFNRLKKSMVRVGDVTTFENFVVKVPAGIEPEKYAAVIVWCESFGQFITAAKYR